MHICNEGLLYIYIHQGCVYIVITVVVLFWTIDFGSLAKGQQSGCHNFL